MRFTDLLQSVSNKIFGFLDEYYYSNQEKIYNNNFQTICEKRYFFIKPEVFLFLPFYQMFLYFHYWTYNQLLLGFISLNSIPITNHLLTSIQKKYNYKFSTNHQFILNLQFPFLYVFILSKIAFGNKTPFQKMSWSLLQSVFYFLSLVHHVHQKRLDRYVETKKNNISETKKNDSEKLLEKKSSKEFAHPFDFCVVDSRPKTIEKILFYMQHFDKDTYYLYTTILLFFFI